jgi:uncharacterized membrane protein YkoI
MTTTAAKAVTAMILGTMAAALLTGCNNTGSDAADDGAQGGPTAAPPSEVASSSASMSASPSPSAGDEDAAFAAIDTVEAAGGDVVGIDREDDGAGGYQVDVLDGNELFEVEVDASGMNPGQRAKGTADAAELDRLKGIAIPLATALETARAEVSGKDIDEAEIDDENGVVVWKIELDADNQAGTEVVVDAANGAVLK